MKRESYTQSFYDGYWPQNVPDYKKTREHVFEIVPNKRYERAFDGGCGTGVNSLAFSEMADNVVAFDLSASVKVWETFFGFSTITINSACQGINFNFLK